MNGARVIRQLPLLAAIGALVFAFLPVSPVRAADIIWGTPTIISGDTDVSTTGTLVHAYAFGNLLVPGATVNGVTFARFAVPNLSSAPT